MRGATRLSHIKDTSSIFQSARPVRGATARIASRREVTPISIRAPRAGRDVIRRDIDYEEYISIRAPRAGRDGCIGIFGRLLSKFQSARPVRGATIRAFISSSRFLFQSARPVRGATDGGQRKALRRSNFNPRAPCGARQQKCTNCLAFFAINSQSKIEIQRPAQAGRAIYTFMQTAMPVKPSANLLSIGCSLAVRTISSVYLPANNFPCSRNARSSFRTAFPDSKTANYRAWDP